MNLNFLLKYLLFYKIKYPNSFIISHPDGRDSTMSDFKRARSDEQKEQRMQEIKERAMVFEGLKHYFIVQFPQRPGALREFVGEVLGPDDDIARFEYTKSNDKEKGPVLIGVELARASDYQSLLERMEAKGFAYTVISEDTLLFNLFV